MKHSFAFPRRPVHAALLALAALGAWPAHAFSLEDTYGMGNDQRVWYFGGVYDAAVADPKTGPCASRLGFERFMQALSKFITQLPADPASATRKSFDHMPAAAVAQLVIQSECRK